MLWLRRHLRGRGRHLRGRHLHAIERLRSRGPTMVRDARRRLSRGLGNLRVGGRAV